MCLFNLSEVLEIKQWIKGTSGCNLFGFFFSEAFDKFFIRELVTGEGSEKLPGIED